jgi:hypothetical protein
LKTRLLFLLLILTFGLGARKANATNTFYWIGGTSTNWQNPVNWNLNGTQITAALILSSPGTYNVYPGISASDIVNIGTSYSYSGNQPTLDNYGGLGATLTIATLNMGANNSGTLTLTTPLTVTGAILTGNDTFTITGGALLTGNSTFAASGLINIGTPTIISSSITFGNSGGTISAGYLTGLSTLTSSGLITVDAPLNITSSLSLTGNNNMTSNASGPINAGNVNMTGSTITLGSSLTVTAAAPNGYIGATASATITGTGAITTREITTSNTFVLSTTGAVAVTGLCNFTGGSGVNVTISSASSFSTANLTDAVTLALSVATTIGAGGTITMSGGVINGTSAASITGGAILTSTGTSAITLLNTLSLSGAMGATSGTLTYSNTGTTTVNSISLTNVGTLQVGTTQATTIGVTTSVGVSSGATLALEGGTINAASMTNSGTLNLLASSTLSTINLSTSSPVNTITNFTMPSSSASLALTGTCAITMSGTITTSGATALSIGSGTTLNLASTSFNMGNSSSIVNNGTFNVLSTCTGFSVSAGPFSFTNNGTFAPTGTSSGITITMSGNGDTFTNSAGATVTASAANFNFSGTCSFSNAGIFDITGNTGSPAATGFVMTAGGTFTNTKTYLGIGAPLTLGANTYVINNTSPGTLTLESGSNLSVTGNSSTFNNTGFISCTSSPIILYNAGPSSYCLNNTGTVLANSSAITLKNNSLIIYNSSTATFTEILSNFSSTGTGNALQNAGVWHATGSTITLPQNGTINNTLKFTADSTSVIYLGAGAAINNNSPGIFNAGTSNSPCDIQTTTSASSTSNVISNASGASFNLGSTSRMTLSNTGGNTMTCNNASGGIFTLQSDQYGSASVGALSTSSTVTKFLGTYNVQRYITGGSGYQGYRLYSSPVSTSSTIPLTSSNYIPFTNLYTGYTVNTGTSTPYYGPITGGLGGKVSGGAGFYLTNTSPTIYLYNETLNPTVATQDKTFTSGKNVGITAISASNVLSWTSTITLPSGSTSTTSSTTTQVPVGNGYLMYFIGSTNGPNASSYTSSTPDYATLTNVGNINQGSISIYPWFKNTVTTLSYTSGSATNTSGYNMIGNPYPSTIDLNLVYNDNSSTLLSGGPTFYELEDNAQTSSFNYVAYIPLNGTSGGGGQTSSSTYAKEYIASGQGFIVVATATPATQSITFKEDQKVYNVSNPSGSGGPTYNPNLMALRTGLAAPANNSLNAPYQPNTKAVITPGNELAGLHLRVSKDNLTFDETGIYFSETWSDNFDSHDALDLNVSSSKVYISSLTADGVHAGINSMGDYTKGKRIKLYVTSTTDGVDNISLEDINNIDTTDYNVYLIDTKQNDSLDMVRYKTYAFNFAVADTASYANRFVLAVEHKQMPPYKLITFVGQKTDNGVQLNWTTENEGDYTGFVLQKQGAGGQYAPIYTRQGDGSGNYTYTDPNPVTGPNIYRLQQNDINGLLTYSGIVTVFYTSSTTSNSAFTVYPNPSRSIININLNSTSTSTSNLQSNIYNTVGQVMAHRTVNGNAWTEDVTAYKAGVYIIELKDNAGNLVGKSKFVKTN